MTNINSTDTFQHAEGHLLPSDFNDFSYYDLKYLEKYLCEHQTMIYKENLLYDSIGTPYWEEHKIFKFTCELMPWANNKVRLLH